MTEPTLFAGLTKIVDLLLKLFERGEANQRLRFEKFYQPLFDDFLVVHRNYITLFSQVRLAIHNAKFSPSEAEQTIAALHKEFSAQRQEYEGIRTKLRAGARSILTKTDDVDERRFLWAILCYFLEHHRPYKSFRELDTEAARLIERGKDEVLDTPASYVLSVLSSSVDLDKLLGATDSIMMDLAGYLSDICNTFATLKLRAYKSAF